LYLFFNDEENLQIIAFHLESKENKIKEIIINFITNMIKNIDCLINKIYDSSIFLKIIRIFQENNEDNNEIIISCLNYIFIFLKTIDKANNRDISIITEEIYFVIIIELSKLLKEKNYFSDVMEPLFCVLRLLQSILDPIVFDRLFMKTKMVEVLYSENFLLDQTVVENFLILIVNIFCKSDILTKV